MEATFHAAVCAAQPRRIEWVIRNNIALTPMRAMFWDFFANPLSVSRICREHKTQAYTPERVGGSTRDIAMP